ncbi:MAG: glycosyltransferase family 2 protein [Pseudomonadota bacterium]
MSEAPAPEVAVIIAAWNAEATLAAAITSVLAQHELHVEVFVIDDASTDATRIVAERVAAADTRVTLVAQSRNAGPAAARNRGVDVSHAPFVTVLDSDDTMAPWRLRRLVDIAREGNWDFVADDLYKVSSDTPDAPRTRLWSQSEIGQVTITFEQFIRGNLRAHHGGRGEMGFLKPLMKRDFLERHGLRYDESMRLGEDYALYATALAKGAKFCLTDPLGYVALVRPESLSGHHCAADLGALAAADKRLRDEPGLTSTERRSVRIHEIETQKRWLWMRLIEAVKARDFREGLRCFAAPPVVVAHLVRSLGEQVWLRSGSVMKTVFSKQS